MSKATILFPTDYSTASAAALVHARSLARRHDARLLVVHVVIPGLSDEIEAVDGQPLVGEEPLQCRDDKKNDAADELEIETEHRVLQGDPASVIVDVARQEEVFMIVMATTGRSALKRLLMGSVAEAVIRRAPCPVCTIRTRESSAKTTASEGRASPGAVGLSIGAARKDGQSTPAVDLLWRALTARATDIHVATASEGIEVRFRIDGRLEHYCNLSRELGNSLVTQFKVMANLDIAEPFHAKEGRLQLPAAMAGHEGRLTIMPVMGGEALALRLLDEQRMVRPLEELGLSSGNLESFHHILKHGEGLVLVTGPTGSGKTTTVYSMLNALEGAHRNILTIEDPVEFMLPVARQISVDPRHGLTLASGLRSLLRMDPDVIMVGEIRDGEAAEMAMRAASSGKYVFSTLHTRDVASTITAVRDLHIDNRSLAANLTGIISQRLVRRLCQECFRTRPPTHEEADYFAARGLAAPDLLAAPVGCPHCRGRGYRERIGVFEVVMNRSDIARAIEEGMPEELLREQIRADTATLAADALEKVSQRLTSLDEVRSMRWAELSATQSAPPTVSDAAVLAGKE